MNAASVSQSITIRRYPKVWKNDKAYNWLIHFYKRLSSKGLEENNIVINDNL